MTEQRGKVGSIEQIKQRVHAAQVAGETVVMCHGCFDIVHPGHVRHLQHARKLGDRLLVTVSGDAAVNKGDGRPLIPQELRSENLAALDCVDWVTIGREPTAEALLVSIRPDIYVKGREYEHNHDPRFEAEKKLVQSYGGRVAFTSGEVVFSSSALIRTLEATASPAHAALRRLVDEAGLDAGKIDDIVGAFRGHRVVVVGETIIDTYIMCARPEVSGESPVLTLRPLERRSFDGGAAIVARHLAALGAEPTLVTALPADERSAEIRRRLDLEGVRIASIDVSSPTHEKQRFLVGPTKMMKVDLGDHFVLDERDQSRLVGLAAMAADEHDAVIVTDFGLGIFTAPMLTELCRAVRPKVDLLTGDVSGRGSNLLAMRDMDLLCPSEVDLRSALSDYDEGLSAVAWNLLRATQCRSAIVTLGDEGLIAFDQRPSAVPGHLDWESRLCARHVPALTAHAVDPLGCGDALLAAATLARGTGASLEHAAIIGSLAAAAEANRLGNVPIGACDLRQAGQRVTGARLEFDLEPGEPGPAAQRQPC